MVANPMYEEIMIADCEHQEATISSLLREGLPKWKRSAPGHRPRLSAREQGASEAELSAVEFGSSVTRLDPHFRGIIYALPAVGEVLAVTKNEHCIHEKQGVFNHVSIGPDQGFVLNRDVDLRLFMSHWRHVFVVREEAAPGPRTSLQFFDSGGAAVHIVYLTERSNRGAFDAIVARFRSTDQSPGIEITSSPPAPQDRPDREINLAEFHACWGAAQAPLDFSSSLFQEFGISRQQAFRLLGEDFAYRVERRSLRLALEAASQTQTPMVCMAGNRGCIQLHTGPVNTPGAAGPWLHVRGPKFNLQLREDDIASAWIVRKPTVYGIMTSLELFNGDGFCFAQFSGARKPGKPQLENWKWIASSLPRLPSPLQLSWKDQRKQWPGTHQGRKADFNLPKTAGPNS
jgi:putative hemin transport protein